MDFESLITILVDEHRVIEQGLAGVRSAARKRDFEGVATELKRLEPIFRQHIVDEESQILRLLVAELGLKGAEYEIRVFQQHRPIHMLMQAVSELASKSAQELETEESKLSALFLEHTTSEERRVFPRALVVYKESSGRHPQEER
jgi:hypothetical protein